MWLMQIVDKGVNGLVLVDVSQCIVYYEVFIVLCQFLVDVICVVVQVGIDEVLCWLYLGVVLLGQYWFLLVCVGEVLCVVEVVQYDYCVLVGVW